MKYATVTTAWAGTGTVRNPYHPAVRDDHSLAGFMDITGADPKKGGVYAVRVACTPAILAAIQANPKYTGKVTVLL